MAENLTEAQRWKVLGGEKRQTEILVSRQQKGQTPQVRQEVIELEF